MKGKTVFTLAIIGALFSLGYSGCEASCDYKSATYKSSDGITWTVNVHVKQCKYIFLALTFMHFYCLLQLCLLQFVSLLQPQIRPALNTRIFNIHAAKRVEAVAIHFME